MVPTLVGVSGRANRLAARRSAAYARAGSSHDWPRLRDLPRERRAPTHPRPSTNGRLRLRVHEQAGRARPEILNPTSPCDRMLSSSATSTKCTELSRPFGLNCLSTTAGTLEVRGRLGMIIASISHSRHGHRMARSCECGLVLCVLQENGHRSWGHSVFVRFGKGTCRKEGGQRPMNSLIRVLRAARARTQHRSNHGVTRDDARLVLHPARCTRHCA